VPGYPQGRGSACRRGDFLRLGWEAATLNHTYEITRSETWNLGILWRRSVLPKGIESWSLTSLQQRLVKTGGRLVQHARYCWLLLAEKHLTRTRFSAMLRRIALLPLPAT
jgi:hypothetical protein